MGLGSEDESIRNEFRSAVGKHDWKSAINGVEDAERTMDKIKENLSIDGNGDYLMAAYMQKKMDLLKEYCDHVKKHGAIKFKDFSRGR